MTKIAVLIGKDFEDSEYAKPAEAFRNAGYQLVHIGLQKGEIVRGKKEASPVQIEIEASHASPDEFEALLIPGGYSPDNLRAHEEPVRFVMEFMDTGKPVFAICHGPQLLISARRMEGRTVTAWKSLIQDIEYAGGKFIDKEVVIDRNLITSRNPSDIPAFILASLEKLKEAEAKAQAA